MTSSDAQFLGGLDLFGSVVANLDDAAWEAQSACNGWSNLDVLGHLSNALGMSIAVLNGTEPTFPEADRPADLVVGSPAEFWFDLDRRCRAAMIGADLDLVMDTPMGPRAVRDRLAFPAMDLYVHAWDIGHAVGIEVELTESFIEFAHHHLDPLPVEMMRNVSGGVFGPEVDAPADATPTEAFVAWTGRTPR